MDLDVFDLQEKTALIVGGGRGIGRSSSLTLARAGCNVAVADNDETRGEAVAQEVRDLGRKATHISADVLDTANVRRMVADSVDRLGKVDIVVSVVGGGIKKMALEFTEEEWDLQHKLNLKHVFFTCQTFAKHIIDRSGTGSIIVISSISGYDSSPYHAPYGAAKAGLVNLTKSLATEWGPHGIRINAIAPGSIATPKATDNFAAMAGRRKALEDILPLRRFGSTDEIAKAVLFFASNLSSYVTGQTLPVDGGRTALYKYWMAS